MAARFGGLPRGLGVPLRADYPRGPSIPCHRPHGHYPLTVSPQSSSMGSPSPLFHGAHPAPHDSQSSPHLRAPPSLPCRPPQPPQCPTLSSPRCFCPLQLPLPAPGVICAPIIDALSVLPRPGAGAHPTALLLLLLPRQPPPSFLPTLHPHRPPGRTAASWLCLHFGFNLPQGFLNLIREGGAAFKGAGLTFAAATRAAWRKKIGCGESGGSERESCCGFTIPK